MALSRITEAVASFTDLTIADDLTLSDDLLLASDANIIKFGTDADVTITHVADTGLLLNSTSVIQFNDASQTIGAPSGTKLDIKAGSEIELTSTLIDIVGNLTVSGTIIGAGALTAATSITVGNAALTEAELELLDGLTAGTAIASKVVTTDAKIDSSGMRNFTITGELDAATLDISGAIDVAGTSNLDVVDIDGAVNMATTALVTGVLTTTAATVFNGGFASNADSTMGTDKKIIFRDAAIHISSTADGDLSIAADDEIDLTSTLIDINGNVEISGTVAAADAITMATNKKVVFRDAALFINSSADGQLDLAADTEIELTATTVDVVGNFTNSGTIVSTGKITSDAGIDIDNFNIDGTTIALSSGDMTVDVAGDLILDAGGGDFKLGVGGTEILRITNSSSDVIIKPIVDAKDIIFQQRDGTPVMTVEDAISLTINNDVSVVGRATGTITTDNDGSLDLAVSNNFKVTTGGDLTLTLTNPAIGQSGNIFFINGSNHTISAHASLLINADVLSAISATGSYHLTYYSTATSGNNTILVSASAILT